MKRPIKINPRARKILRVKDVYWDMTDEEFSRLKESFPDLNIKEELGKIARKVEEEPTKCPECGGSPVYAISSSNLMGVGKTGAQKEMRSFTIFYEVVCSKCGLVLGQATHNVDR